MTILMHGKVVYFAIQSLTINMEAETREML